MKTSAKNKLYKGGLFDGRGKPQPLAMRKGSEKEVTPEKKIQQRFIAWRNMFQRDFPILRSIFAVPNGIWTFKSVAQAMIGQGMTAGIPDIICLAPSHDRKFHALLIEFKTEKGEPSDEQKFFLQFFADLGYRTTICRNEWTAAQLVNEHLGTKVPITPRG
jgi:hypothetical protein